MSRLPLPRRPFFGTEEPGDDLAGARLLPLALIDPNPEQPRRLFRDLDELAADIAERGVLQPIVVRTHPTTPGRYLIVAGERRYRATVAAGLAAIPATIREYSDPLAAAADTAVENLQRSDLTLAEEVALYHTLMTAWDLRFAAGLAERLHRPVRRLQRLLQLAEHPDLLAQVDAEELTLREALERMKRASPEKRRGDVFAEDAPAPAVSTPGTATPRHDRFPADGTAVAVEAGTPPEKRRGDVFPPAAPALPHPPAGATALAPSAILAGLTQFQSWLDGIVADQLRPNERDVIRGRLEEVRDVAHNLAAYLREYPDAD